MERLGAKAHIFELDGVVLELKSPIPTLARLSERAKSCFEDSSLERLILDDIPHLDHTWQNVSTPSIFISGRSIFDYFMVRAAPGIKDRLEGLFSNKEDLYGNTARSSKQSSVKRTQWSLAKQGVGRFFKSISHTPDGVDFATSTADVVRNFIHKYDELEYTGANKTVALVIAGLFPEAQVNYMYYEFTGKPISKAEQEDNRNIKVVSIDPWRRH